MSDCAAQLAQWSDWPVERTQSGAAALAELAERFDALMAARRDARTPLAALLTLGRRLAAAHARACDELDAIVGAGLKAREGRFVVPAVCPPTDADLLAWSGICFWLELLGVPTWDGSRSTPKLTRLCVCDGCTLVFRPKAKRSARWCPLCTHKRPAPALGIGHEPLERRGDRITVRVPKFEGGHLVVGWRRMTVGLCPECGEPFGGNADKRTCSERCARRRSRRS